MRRVSTFAIGTALLAAFAPAWLHGQQPTTTMLKTERFESDPGWEGHRNRVLVKKPLTVKQDFGHSATHFAGNQPGELGGVIQRANTLASYAIRIDNKTLDDSLTASGSFAITASQAGAGVFFGFFHSQQPGGSGRPIGSLGLNFDFELSGGRLAVRLITNTNKSCGTFITPYLPGKYRPTPIKNDGSRYFWTLAYDPQAAGGRGSVTFTLRSDRQQTEPIAPDLSAPARQEALDRFPHTTSFTVELPPGLREEGASFDRFGVMNMMKSGGSATMYFDDLQWNGNSHDFATAPDWIEMGNRISYEDRELVGAHDFGYSPKTAHAGGASGEVGGSLWRGGDYGYYADRIGTLTLDQKLEARGKVKLVTAGPDSDMYLGWFNSASKDQPPSEGGHFVGVHVGGPTRIGHYFSPRVATAKGSPGKVDEGPILVPGKAVPWSLVYDPAGHGGRGALQVTLGQQSVVLPFQPGQKAEGATLDRFGLFTSTTGGQMLKIYLDDVSYTVGK